MKFLIATFVIFALMAMVAVAPAMAQDPTAVPDGTDGQATTEQTRALTARVWRAQSEARAMWSRVATR